MRQLIFITLLLAFILGCAPKSKNYSDLYERGKQIRQEQAERDWQYNQRKQRYGD